MTFDLKEDVVVVLEALIYDVKLLEMPQLVFLHSDVEGTDAVKGLKHVGIARLHFLSDQHFQISQSVPFLHHDQHVFLWVCHQGSFKHDL